MTDKVGRNDPCPCGSGKKYKSCCLKNVPVKKSKFTAKWLSKPEEKPVNLMERTYGAAISLGMQSTRPPAPAETAEKETEQPEQSSQPEQP